MSNDPEQILRASMQDFGETRSSRSSHRAERTSHASSKYESPQHCSSGGSHNWESLMGLSDHHDRSAYKKGGSIRAAAQKLRHMGRGGDTDVVHVNEKEKRVLKAMGGRGTVNPKTGLREYVNDKKSREAYEAAQGKVAATRADLENHHVQNPNYHLDSALMDKFLDAKHEKTKAKHNYVVKARHKYTPPDQDEKLKWKIENGGNVAGKNDHRISRAAREAIRIKHPDLLPLYEMFEGKREFEPSTVKHFDKTKPSTKQTLNDNLQTIQNYITERKAKNGKAINSAFSDENSLMNPQKHLDTTVNPHQIVKYDRPQLTKKELKQAAKDASKNEALVSINGMAYKDLQPTTVAPLLQSQNKIQAMLDHNTAALNGNMPFHRWNGMVPPLVGVVPHPDPTKQVQNRSSYAFNGTNIGKHEKKNPFYEVGDGDLMNAEVFKSGRGEFIPSKKIDVAIHPYLKNKFGHTTCMESNYRSNIEPTPAGSAPYPKASLHNLTSDSVNKQLSVKNHEKLIQNNRDNKKNMAANRPTYGVQYYGGHPAIPNNSSYGQTKPNSISIDSSTVENGAAHRLGLLDPTLAALQPKEQTSYVPNPVHGQPPIQLQYGIAGPFTRVDHNMKVTQPDIEQQTKDNLSFLRTQQPMKYSPGYADNIITSHYPPAVKKKIKINP